MLPSCFPSFHTTPKKDAKQHPPAPASLVRYAHIGPTYKMISLSLSVSYLEHTNCKSIPLNPVYVHFQCALELSPPTVELNQHHRRPD